MDTDITTRIENAQERWRKAVIFDKKLFETISLLGDAKQEIEQQRKILDWLLPQVFKRCHPEFDLGHPHMYVLNTAIKNQNITDDMWKVIRRSLEGRL